jgi:hypothetical protein
MVTAVFGHQRRGEPVRYEGYVAVREAIAGESLDGHVAELVSDLAEDLLLARGRDEAEIARDRVPTALVELVDCGELSRFAANRLWARIRACGPGMHWPPSWPGDAAPAGWAVPGG